MEKKQIDTFAVAITAFCDWSPTPKIWYVLSKRPPLPSLGEARSGQGDAGGHRGPQALTSLAPWTICGGLGSEDVPHRRQGERAVCWHSSEACNHPSGQGPAGHITAHPRRAPSHQSETHTLSLRRHFILDVNSINSVFFSLQSQCEEFKSSKRGIGSSACIYHPDSHLMPWLQHPPNQEWVKV